MEEGHYPFMSLKPIYISTDEHQYLTKLLHSLSSPKGGLQGTLQQLEKELKRATVVNTSALPAGVVKLNTKVTLRDLESGEEDEYVLTTPEKANPDLQRLSILAPIGTAILGFVEGDEVSWETPGGVRRFRIEKVEPCAPIGYDISSIL